MSPVITEFIRRHTYDDHASLGLSLTLLTTLGLIIGRILAGWSRRLVNQPPVIRRAPCPECGRKSSFLERIPFLGTFFLGKGCSACRISRAEIFTMELAMAALYLIVFLGIAQFRCQEIVEGGRLDWYPVRILSQLVLVTLMLAATYTDFKDHVIPDVITIPGMLFAVAIATWAGNIQILPLWIDWNDVQVALHGPYIPDWIKHHDHWHGFAWSLAGLLAGAAMTGLVWAVSRMVLGQESLGTGDITLMAMIGAFLGWQPVLFAFAIAPAWGILVGLLLWLITGKPYIPFGPYLCAGALTVMLAWRWIWPPVRLIFGHPPTLLLLGAGILLGFIILLSLVRLFRAIPVKGRAR